MRLVLLLIVIVFSLCAGALAQGVMGDVFAGSLVKPRVGQWAWYDLVDSESGRKFVVRQAIVGKERVGRRTGHWLEIEIVPQLGYPSVFKMLLTGPASDPKNIHRIIHMSGDNAPEEMPVVDVPADGEKAVELERRFICDEDVETISGVVKAEKYIVGDGVSEIWLNEKVRPVGIVRFRSSEGELTLREYGVGGEYAKSAIGRSVSKDESGGNAGRISVSVESEKPKRKK